jgi:hypothetical protein
LFVSDDSGVRIGVVKTPESGILGVSSTERGRKVVYNTPGALMEMELDTGFIGDGVWYQTQYDNTIIGDGTPVRSAVYGIGLCNNNASVQYMDLLYDPTLTIALLGGVATPDTPPSVAAKRNPVWVPIVATVCVVLAAAVVGIAFFIWYRNRDAALKGDSEDYTYRPTDSNTTRASATAPTAVTTPASPSNTSNSRMTTDDGSGWTKYTKKGSE